MPISLGDVKNKGIKVKRIDQEEPKPITIPSLYNNVKVKGGILMPLPDTQTNKENTSRQMTTEQMIDDLNKNTTNIINNEGYTDTGKKYGDYRYWDYKNKGNYKIYSKNGKYFYYDEKNGKYTELDNESRMTTPELEKKEYEEAKRLGYKDNNSKLKIENQLDLDTTNLTKEEKKAYEKDLQRQQNEYNKKISEVRYGGAGLKGSLGEVKESLKRINENLINPIKDIPEDLKLGYLNTQLGLESFKKMNGQKNNYDQIKEQVDKYSKFNQDIVTSNNLINQNTQNTPNQVLGTINGIKNAGVGGTIGAVGGGLVGLATAGTSGIMPGMKEGTKFLGGAGYTKGQTEFTYQLEAGYEYQALLEMGVPESIARKEAKQVGTENALIEAGESIVDLITLGQASKVRQILGDKLVKKYGLETIKNWAKSTSSSYLTNIVSEGLEESAQEWRSIEGEKRATQQVGIKRDNSQDKERILQSGIGGAFGGAVGGVFTRPVGSSVLGVFNNNNTTNNQIANQVDAFNLTPKERVQSPVVSSNSTGVVENSLTNDNNNRYQQLNDNNSQQKFYQEIKNTDSIQKQRVYQQANSKNVLNNSKETHDLVDFIANLSEYTRRDYNIVTNNELQDRYQQLREMGASENTFINGLEDNNGVTINLDSDVAFERTLMHETGHVLHEADPKLVEKFNNYLKEYAELKNDNITLNDNYNKIGANLDEETSVELFSKYMLTEENKGFIKELHAKDYNLFTKLHDWVKHLCNLATSGSREQRVLENLRYTMDKLNESQIKNKQNESVKGINFSISDIKGQNGNYGTGVILDTNFFDGVKPRNWGKLVNEFIYNNLAGKTINVYDENNRLEQISFAKSNERVRKDGAKNSRKVIDKLSRTNPNNNIKNLSIVQIEEVLQASKEINSNNENTHQWLDENGWSKKRVYLQSKNGEIYEAVLNIAKTRDGRNILYDINKPKKVDDAETSSIKGHSRTSTFVPNNIPQNNKNVKLDTSSNNSDMQENTKYSLGEGGYYGHRMSKRALLAYDYGEKPISKWTKSAIIEEINDNIETDVDLSKLTLKELRDNFLTLTSWHHTGALYNETDFYSIDESALEDLSNETIDEIISNRKEITPEEKAQRRETRLKKQEEIENSKKIYYMIETIKEASIPGMKSNQKLYDLYKNGQLDSAYQKAIDVIKERDKNQIQEFERQIENAKRKGYQNHWRTQEVTNYYNNPGEYIKDKYLQDPNKNRKGYKFSKSLLQEQGIKFLMSDNNNMQDNTRNNQNNEIVKSDTSSANSNIQGLEKYTTKEIKDITLDYINNIMKENDINATIENIDLHGSRLRGDAKQNSDLDVVVQYKGDIREDSLFNILNEENLEIDGVKVDINPIQENIKDYMKKSNEYDENIKNKDIRFSMSDNHNEFNIFSNDVKKQNNSMYALSDTANEIRESRKLKDAPITGYTKDGAPIYRQANGVDTFYLADEKVNNNDNVVATPDEQLHEKIVNKKDNVYTMISKDSMKKLQDTGLNIKYDDVNIDYNVSDKIIKRGTELVTDLVRKTENILEDGAIKKLSDHEVQITYQENGYEYMMKVNDSDGMTNIEDFNKRKLSNLPRLSLTDNDDSKQLTPQTTSRELIDSINLPSDIRESKFYKNITEKSQFITEENRSKLSQEDIKYYEKVTNKESMDKALNRLDNGNMVDEITNWYSKESKNADSTDVAEGWILLKRYQDAGDYNSMVQVAKKMREIGTKSGQTVQMFNLLSRLTPEGMVKYAQQELSEAYEVYIKNQSKEWIDANRDKFDLTPDETKFIVDTMNEIQNMEDGYNKKVKLAQIQSMLQNKLPPAKGAGIKAWMRISMLFNPKTQIRNIVGNALIAPVNMVGDVFASGADKLIAKKTGIRTTGMPKVSNLIKGAKQGLFESYNDFKLGIDTRNIKGNRFEVGQGKNFKERTKMGKLLNKTDRLLSFCLDAGDRPFYESAFVNSINNQLVLNNTTEVTQDMIDIATNEALQRTWQDNNKYTQFVLNVRKGLNNLVGIQDNSNSGGGGYGLGDVLIPFAKTPANLTKAIVDYSPVGLVKTLTIDASKFKKSLSNGQYTAQQQHQFVQNLGKATAGSLLYILGYSLAKTGITSGKSDDDKDVANFIKNALGITSYSIKIGDKTFTYDWAQPISAPFSITADLVNNKNDKATLLEKITSTLDVPFNLILEQSFLSGLQDVLSNYEGIPAGLLEQVMDLPARATPTLFKQITDMVDTTQRTTFEKGEPIQSAINSIKSKIPTLSKDLAPTRDSLGREIKKYGGDVNLFNVFLNPANMNKGKESESAKEIYKVYKATGDNSVMPRIAPYKIDQTIDGKKYSTTLNSKQRSEFQKISGEIIEKNVKKLKSNYLYKNQLTNEERVEVINGIVDYAYNKAKSKVTKKPISRNYKTIDEEVRNGYALYDLYAERVYDRR